SDSPRKSPKVSKHVKISIEKEIKGNNDIQIEDNYITNKNAKLSLQDILDDKKPRSDCSQSLVLNKTKKNSIYTKRSNSEPKLPTWCDGYYHDTSISISRLKKNAN